MDSYKLSAGGQTWTIGLPHTSERVTVSIHGKDWPMDVVKAVSAQGTFLIADYKKWDWREEHRPFESNCVIALDSKGKVMAKAAILHTALWTLATGKDPSTLPDCAFTADGGFDSQPTSRPARPQAPAQPRQHEQQQAREPQRPREGARQRLGRLVRLFKDREGT